MQRTETELAKQQALVEKYQRKLIEKPQNSAAWEYAIKFFQGRVKRLEMVLAAERKRGWPGE